MTDATQNLALQLNGKPCSIENMGDIVSLTKVIKALELKTDRIAVELNGEIVRRVSWPETAVRSGDRLEIVHFVGGGLAAL